MNDTHRWQDALVVGLGRSGMAAARLLLELGVRVRGYDRRPHIDDCPAALTLDLGAPTPSDASFHGIDLLVLSPGVDPRPLLHRRDASCPQVEVHGEMSLALELAQQSVRPPWRAPKLVLVTGTNGKSTVTAMTGAMLAEGGQQVFTGGNLGTPLCELLLAALHGDLTWPKVMVLECSSFQLETMPRVTADVGILLNVTPDHLDRYASMDEYAATKARVFSGLGPGGLALLDAHDRFTPQLRRDIQAPVLLVDDVDGAYIDERGEDTLLRLPDGTTVPRQALKLAGRHNAKNALFALAAARHLGVPLDACTAALARFEGLPHRMAFVRELDAVAYFDDSKATNIASVLASLDGFERPYVLIMGGRAKGDDPHAIAPLLPRARAVVGIGEAGPSFVAVARDHVPTILAFDMADAVERARGFARPGDAVVLAPACSSFDWFDNYAHRGDVFTRAVLALMPS